MEDYGPVGALGDPLDHHSPFDAVLVSSFY